MSHAVPEESPKGDSESGRLQKLEKEALSRLSFPVRLCSISLSGREHHTNPHCLLVFKGV